jgi:hypothetical protein
VQEWKEWKRNWLPRKLLETLTQELTNH